MPTTTANILFTDVEGSTAVRTRIGEAAADRLFVDHERLLGRVVERQHGRVIKTAGDGIMAAFDSASDAVHAAVLMQQAMTRRPGELTIRVGVAAGDVSWEDNDCFGLPVVTAARLQAAAAGGQILVSQVVRWLAGDRSDAVFEPVGALELKGLAEPVEAFAVAWRPEEQEGGGTRVPLPAALTTPPPFGFVGREQEWQVLTDAWDDALAGGRRVVLLGGEAGAGKSRLAFELARQLSDDGAAVLHGGCDPQLVIPYQPWVQALDHLLRTLTVDELDDDVAGDLSALAPLLPRLDRPGASQVSSYADAETERYRLFAAVDAVLAEAARRWPLVVVLDDLHWAAAQTLALLAHIARAGTGTRLLVVGTFRDTGDEMTETLTTALADLRRLDNVARLRLAGLGGADVASLVGGVIGQELDEPLGRLAAAVTERSRGNPFFVGELWRQLVANGAVERDSGAWVVRAPFDDVAVPDSVREVVAERLARLSFSARRLADLVAVAGSRVALSVLLGAVDSTAAEVTAGLDELTGAGLLETVDRPLLAYQFTHALVRDTVEGAIPAASRAQLHLRVGEAIESAHESDRRPVLADLARHFAEAAALGSSGKAVYYARRAAEQAMSSLGFDEAAAHLGTALDLTPHGSMARAEVLVGLGAAMLHRSDFAESERFYEEAFHLAREHGEAALAAEAALGFEDAVHSPGMPGEPALVMVSEAIRLVGDDVTSLRARLEAARARALTHSGRPDEARAALETALDMARRTDDHALALALTAGLIGSTDPDELLDYAAQMQEVATRLDEPWYAAYATVNQLRAYVMIGDLVHAKAVLDVHRSVVSRSPHPILIVEGLCYELMLAFAEGRFDDAEAAAEKALATGFDKHPGAPGMYGLQMFAIRREQGRLAEVAPVLEAVAKRGEGGGVWRPGLAVLHAELGRLDEARADFDALAADDFVSVPRDSLWPACVGFLGEVCIALGDRARAVILYDELLAFEGRTLTVGYSMCFGPADRLLGALATLLGRPKDADRHFRRALELAQGGGAALWQAQVERDWGRGATAVAHPDGLSSREVDVLRLVAAGRSNREIGEHLMISPNTAANHVRAILQKTASANRAEAAAYAARHALLD